MREDNWRDEIVDAAEASAGIPVTWELLVDHVERVRYDIRMLRLEVEKLEQVSAQHGADGVYG